MIRKNAKVTNNGSFRYIVALDAHKRTYFIKIVDTSNDSVIFNAAIIGSIKNVLEILKTHKLPPTETQAIYEAGAVGFHPYWQLQENGYNCLVIAPSSIPQNNRLRKSDRHDASDILKYHRANILRYVTVPDKDIIHLRELNRYRDTLVEDIRKKKQLINAFTLRNGHIFNETKCDWGIKHRKWLEQLPLVTTAKATLQLMLDELHSAEAHLEKCEKQQQTELKARPVLERQVKLYELLPGFGTITSQTIVFECGDMNRFHKADQVSRYIGLTPGMHQSADKNPSLSITKEGNAFARRMLIGASKYYGDQRCLYSEKHLALMPETIAEFIKKMQMRLNSRYRYLKGKGKQTNKVRCAIARELVMFLWEFSVKVIPKQDEIHAQSKKAA